MSVQYRDKRAASHDSKPALSHLTADYHNGMINHTIILMAEIIVKDLHLSRYHEYQCASFVGVRQVIVIPQTIFRSMRLKRT